MEQKKKEIIIITAMIISALLMILIMRLTGGGSSVVVTYGGEVYGTYDLNKNRTVEVTTELGTNIFEIKDGAVNMISATCPDKLCVNMFPISKDMPGVIVCLPNEVVLEIEDK